ncbi:MAG: antitoxin ParD1/3/4 [Sphingomonadales bacterium]|jgi:antitoxin ParD1/3/4|nr:antitoxin ParD1/3/4 [Sphingomonadales bacterium]
MATMNISLPDDLKAYVDRRVAGRYSTSSEFVRELIRKDHDLHRLRELILEGAASPLEGPIDEAFFNGLHGLAARHARK